MALSILTMYSLVAGLELTVQTRLTVFSPEGWDCRRVPPGPTFSLFFAALRNSAGWPSALVSLIVLQSLYRHLALCWEALCLNASLWSHKSKKRGLCSFPAQVIQLMFVNRVSGRQKPGLHRQDCYHSIYLRILSSVWGPCDTQGQCHSFSHSRKDTTVRSGANKHSKPSPLDFILCVLIEVCATKPHPNLGSLSYPRSYWNSQRCLRMGY